MYQGDSRCDLGEGDLVGSHFESAQLPGGDAPQRKHLKGVTENIWSQIRVFRKTGNAGDGTLPHTCHFSTGVCLLKCC